MFFGIWNIRGLVNPLRQAEIRAFIRIHRLSCIGIVETKVKANLFDDISGGLCNGWRWISNYGSSPLGRIWFGWNPNDLDLSLLFSSDQLIHLQIKLLNWHKSCLLSIVYGEHTFVLRRHLWADLIRLSSCDLPWIVASDFNAIKDPQDRVGSTTPWIPIFDEFADCLNQAGLEDLRYAGYRDTWSHSSGENRKLRKIDRVLSNALWNHHFSFSEATFLAPGISDHSPMVVKLYPPQCSRKPFKFFNLWTSHPDFLAMVTQAWNSQVVGSPMYQVCCKLRLLKAKLKLLNRSSFSDISSRCEQARADLHATQSALEEQPFDQNLLSREVD